MISQIANGVFHGFPPGFYFVVTVTGIILVLAANTAFNGFPVLGSILAHDGLAPRSLGSRGDRLAYSNGIVFLAAMSIILIMTFDAETTKLIQLYIVGVFVSFNLSQLGMIRHWTRHLKATTDPAARRRMMRSRAINTFGLGMTAVVLVIVVVTKFLAGAWITIIAMVVFFVIMKGISNHYTMVEAELAADEQDKLLPTRVHAIVLVSKLHKPTLRALAFAKATRPNLLEGIYVSVDAASTNRLLEEWDERNLGTPLKVLHSPYREIVRPHRRVRPGDPTVQPAWRRGRLHPRVRRGSLVGAAPAQPDRPAAQGPTALHARRHGHLGALPAAVLHDRRGARLARGQPGAGRRPSPWPRPARQQRRRLRPADRPVTRRPRARKERGRSRVGERFEAVVGPVAHGGHCIVRLPEPESRVVFTRHCLPGERVVVEITEGNDGDRFWRGDAVAVLAPSPDRVPAPCPVAGPGLCGGCDFQHASLPAQRHLKAAVVAEQLRRLAGLDVDVTVEAVPGDEEGLRWRTRMQWAYTPEGQRGLRPTARAAWSLSTTA